MNALVGLALCRVEATDLFELFGEALYLVIMLVWRAIVVPQIMLVAFR